jgi:hypothetical protein|tara:strand:+ start:285 stop:485 length:201 start_codon:yes stop_codon:yes gene_type:complete
MNDEIRAALILRYRAAMAEAEANIQVYLRHPAGIGEHSDIVGAVDEQIEKAAAASEKLDYISGLKY